MSSGLTIVCASNDRAVLEANLLRSPCIARQAVPCIVETGYANVPTAYNHAAAEARTDLLCFAHQDVFLPEGWVEALVGQVGLVAERDPDWGVLGSAGVVIRDNTKEWVGHALDGGDAFGKPEGLPAEADTLDEMLLVCRKQDAAFDEMMPSHHLFGAELCLRLRREGRRSYAIDAYCEHHSTQPRNQLPPEFVLSCGYLYAKFADVLPIVTTCVTIQRVNGVCSLSL